MASILSRLRAGRWELPRVPPGEIRSKCLAIAEFMAKQICRTGPDAPKLVNIQAVACDVIKPVGDDGEIEFDTTYSKLPPVTPGFPELWLECNLGEIPLGFLVRREDREDGWDIQIYTWELIDNRVIGPTVLQRVALPSSGRMSEVKGVATQTWNEKPLVDDLGKVLLKLRLFVVMSALARMNCRNVELRQIPGAKAPRYQGSITPASIWHEIHVSSVPRLRSTGKASGQIDERLIRCHWIRGHYADYTDGPGLFGNPKLRCVFWIPEHQKGNAELGNVIPEYRLE